MLTVKFIGMPLGTLVKVDAYDLTTKLYQRRFMARRKEDYVPLFRNDVHNKFRTTFKRIWQKFWSCSGGTLTRLRLSGVFLYKFSFVVFLTHQEASFLSHLRIVFIYLNELMKMQMFITINFQYNSKYVGTCLLLKP